jgi:hypothetical protein
LLRVRCSGRPAAEVGVSKKQSKCTISSRYVARSTSESTQSESLRSLSVPSHTEAEDFRSKSGLTPGRVPRWHIRVNQATYVIPFSPVTPTTCKAVMRLTFALYTSHQSQTPERPDDHSRCRQNPCKSWLLDLYSAVSSTDAVTYTKFQ